MIFICRLQARFLPRWGSHLEDSTMPEKQCSQLLSRRQVLDLFGQDNPGPHHVHRTRQCALWSDKLARRDCQVGRNRFGNGLGGRKSFGASPWAQGGGLGRPSLPQARRPDYQPVVLLRGDSVLKRMRTYLWLDGKPTPRTLEKLTFAGALCVQALCLLPPPPLAVVCAMAVGHLHPPPQVQRG